MEHLTQKQIEDYSRRRLPAAELLAVSDHLGECEACRRGIESNDAAFFALHEAAFDEDENAKHLTAKQTADYVDKGLAGEALQMVDDHLTRCEQCALAVAGLRAFRNAIAPSLDHEYGPTTAPVKRGWREKFCPYLRWRLCPRLQARRWQCSCWPRSHGSCGAQRTKTNNKSRLRQRPFRSQRR